ncbi:MAG: ABC transporter permease [Bacteroidetes bacterium]|nr:ABC transporter permease [Bacteroidota bacterium]
MSALTALWHREVTTFLRDRARVAGALVQPLLFWALLAFGFGPSFQGPQGEVGAVGFGAFLAPGMLALVVVFTAIFTTLYVVEERTEGFLQTVLVAPVPRLAVALGVALGGATLAVGQAVPFALALPLLGVSLTWSGAAMVLVHLVLLGLAFTALGFVLAWRVSTTRAYHGLMNGLLMPLWLVSGAVFPVEGLAAPLAWAVRLNPVAYSVDGLRHALLGTGWASPSVDLTVAAVFCAAMLLLAAKTAERNG